MTLVGCHWPSLEEAGEGCLVLRACGRRAGSEAVEHARALNLEGIVSTVFGRAAERTISTSSREDLSRSTAPTFGTSSVRPRSDGGKHHAEMPVALATRRRIVWLGSLLRIV